MPIYEFQCKSCGNRFSELRKMGDDLNVICPSCDSNDTGKLMSSFSSKSSGGSFPGGSGCLPSGGG